MELSNLVYSTIYFIQITILQTFSSVWFLLNSHQCGDTSGEARGFRAREGSERAKGLRWVYEGFSRGLRGLRGAYEEFTRSLREISEGSRRDLRGVYERSTRSLREIYEGFARAQISRVSPHETRDFLTSSILDLILLTSFWPRSWTSFADMSHAMWNFKAWIRSVDNKQSRQSLALLTLE